MFKQMNSIQDLWTYCTICPLCQKSCRNPLITIGPISKVKLISSKKEDNRLYISLHSNCNIPSKIRIMIDCEDNTYISSAKLDNIYCNIRSDCRICNCSSIISTDCVFNDKVEFIGVKSESIYLLLTENKYCVTVDYARNMMKVSNCFKDESGIIIDDNKQAIVPLAKIDWSNPIKAANKIKTLIVFS